MNLFALATFAEVAFIEIHAAGSPKSKLAAEREGGIRRSVSLLQKMNPTALSLLVGVALLAVIWAAPSAMAQPSPSGPPVVGVIKVERRPMTDSYEFNGRIQATNSVNIIARVTAFLDQQLFTEGTDVKKGDLLYTLERPPFQAAVDVQEAAVAQAKAQLENSNIELWRKQELLEKNAGSKQALDSAQATQRVATAQLQSAQAQLERARIDLGYTEIRSPIDGRIGRASATVGNMVGQTSGALSTVVSQDPMYVVFSVPSAEPSSCGDEIRERRVRCGEDPTSPSGREGSMARPGSSTSSITRSHRIPTHSFSAGSFSNPVLGQETAGGVNLRRACGRRVRDRTS